MADEKEKTSEPVESEDVPSDFFDDFSKEEFIEGLSVIDSWDDGDRKRQSRFDESTLDSVKDIRELIREDDCSRKRKDSSDRRSDGKQKIDDYYRTLKKKVKELSTEFDLDDVIKPGSRRDPNKTNEAIKRDKEVKVREYLGKCLEGNDELLPPGTELDHIEEKLILCDKKKDGQKEFKRKESVKRPHWSPKRIPRSSPWRGPRRSPVHSPRRSPVRSPRRSPVRSQRRSPRRNLRRSRSPRRSPRYSPRHSPRRPRRPYSPSRRSPQRFPRTRSPLEHSSSQHYRRRSRSRDNFLYPESSSSYRPQETVSFASQLQNMYGAPEPTYSQTNYYSSYSGVGYEFGIPAVEPPQPVPAPLPAPLAAPAPAPPMVPAPSQLAPPPNQVAPCDALAQLVADGKLSKEDYLKLAPKGVTSPLDINARVAVLSRCNQAYNRLTNKQMLPTHLVMLNELMYLQEPMCLAPKFCSPLKRQGAIEYHFTKASSSAAQPNKQIIDAVVAAIGFDKMAAKPRPTAHKDTKDAAVQTTKTCCDACEIRASTTFAAASTSTDPHFFSVSTHTQVVEQDLMSSKVVFNPSGSVGDAAPISIAHLTPAQLVSQLAARAKTLKQSDPPQFSRRHPPYGDYHNYNNYRY